MKIEYGTLVMEDVAVPVRIVKYTVHHDGTRTYSVRTLKGTATEDYLSWVEQELLYGKAKKNI